MPEKTHVDRPDRLKRAVQILAEGQISLQKIVADLATATRRGFDEVAAKFKETDERFRETDKLFRETDRRLDERSRESEERSKRLDERIDKLVSAIGEFMRRPDRPQA